MRLTRQILLLPALALTLFASCKKDEETKVAPPTVSGFELGASNSQQAYAGSELHIAAEVKSDDKIASIRVQIIQKSGVSYTSKYGKDTLYTKYADVKNTTFHEHIKFTTATALGKYDFIMSVQDTKGQVTEIKKELEILALNDFTAPVITVTSAPTNGQIFLKGQTLNIKGRVTEDKALGAVYVGLIREDQLLDDKLVNGANTIGMYLAYDIPAPANDLSFDANIVIGADKDIQKSITGNLAWATGKYYIVVVATSAYGSERAFSAHYPIQINL
jgi:hypothetical protein